MRVVGLALAMGLVMVGCGDAAATAAPDRPGARPDDGAPSTGEPGTTPEAPGTAPEEPAATARNKYVDCQGEHCVHGFAIGTVHYIVFPDATEGLDPSSADYLDVPGAYDITFVPRQDGGPTVGAGDGPDRTLYKDFNLPVVIPLGFGFAEFLTIDFHVVDTSGAYPDIECDLDLFASGVLSGAVVREPGVLVCSTQNWEAPQSPAAPGLLIEFALCDGPASAPCIY